MKVNLEAKVTPCLTYTLHLTDKDIIELLRAAGYKIPQEATVVHPYLQSVNKTTTIYWSQDD